MKTTTEAARRVKPRIAGIREVKARLSEVLRDVQGGHDWTITERGRPIARIVPVEVQSLSFDERIAQLERNGIIGPAPTAPKPIPPPLPIETNLARKLLDEDRNS